MSEAIAATPKKKRQVRPIPDPLEKWEADAFFATFKVTSKPGGQTVLRNVVMFKAMYLAGLRCCEVVGLRHQDLALGGHRPMLKLVNTKYGKPRNVPIPPELVAWLGVWLKVGQKFPATEWVFCAENGKQVFDTDVRRVARRHSKLAGLAKAAHPHRWRHTYATELLEEGMPINHVQALLGHARLSMTEIYLHVRPAAIGDWMAERKTGDVPAVIERAAGGRSGTLIPGATLAPA